jgi:U2 small nuclear ribonucleoprotein B''
MRGQAHIVFRDIQTSTQAMRAMQGFDLFGKEMVRNKFSPITIGQQLSTAQKIVYGKGQSHIIAKLRGTFEMPVTATEATATTDLQKSIFNAPPGSVPSKPANTTESKPSEPGAPHGVKRPRDEEEEDDQGEAPMEEDEDSDAPMDASSDED